MISGGGAGRKYLPSAKAEITTNAIASNGLVRFIFPPRAAQSSHNGPRSQERQPFRVNRPPQVVQKFAKRMMGEFRF